tara:strand:- start:3349 stop:5121 length:1773 start_codon:yes stop_codon:yes gene_type:complete
MPKIPTFTSTSTPTEQVGSVKTNLQISPTNTTAATLLPAAKAIDEFYIKQRDNNEKLEAKKKFFEMKSESDKIIDSLKNNPDDDVSVNLYNEEFNLFKNQQLSQIKNKRVKKKLEILLDYDQSESVYKVKSNSFKAFEEQNLSIYNTEQNTYAAEYSLATDPKMKEAAKTKRIESATEFSNMNNMGKSWLDKEIQTINTDSAIFDADIAIANKNYVKAKEILSNAKNVDSEEIQKRIIKIEKEGLEYDATSFYTSQIFDGKNPFLGTTIQNTTEKKVLQNTDNLLLANAAKNNFSVGETFAYVDRVYTPTGLLSNYYEDLFSSAYTAGSSTTFDNAADIPNVINEAVAAAEAAEVDGRLNVYTTDDEERFFKNVIILKKVLGLDNFQAMKQAKDFEINYDKRIMQGANKQRNKLMGDVEDKFDEIKGTNIQDVRGYANKIFNIYVANGISAYQAKEQVKEDLEKNIIVVDDYAYLKRDIDAFKSIGALGQVKVVKEYILENNITDAEEEDYYLRYNGGGQFEIRRRVDISPVYNDEGEPMIYYAKDLYEINQERMSKIEKEERKKVFEKQERKQILKEAQEVTGFDITGS